MNKKLAGKMRSFGFDTLIRKDQSRQELLDLCIQEQRILLTGNSQLKDANSPAVILYFQTPTNVNEEIQELIS